MIGAGILIMSFLKKLAAVAGSVTPERRLFADEDSRNIFQFFLEDLPAMEAGMLAASAKGFKNYEYNVKMYRNEPCEYKFYDNFRKECYTLSEYLDIVIIGLKDVSHEEFLKEWFDGIDVSGVEYDKYHNKIESLQFQGKIHFSWWLAKDSDTESE